MDLTPVVIGQTDRTLDVACRMLLRAAAPIGVADLAAALGEPEAVLDALVGEYERLGRMKRDGATVVASLGISAVPSEFEIRLGTQPMWAWCAKSALGVVSALGLPGMVIGRSPVSGSALSVVFDESGNVSEGPAVFWPDDTLRDSCGSAEREYCPAFTMLEDPATARSWARDRGYRGEVLSTGEAAARARVYWDPILDLECQGSDLPAWLRSQAGG